MSDPLIRLHRRTKRLIVRPMDRSDYISWKDAHLSLRSAVNRWDMGPPAESVLTKFAFANLLRSQINSRRDGKDFHFGIFLKDDRLIGLVSLMDVSRGLFQNAYIGYRLFNPHWGKGYASEAVKAAIDIAFKDLNLHRIEAGIEPKNKRSIALAKSLGLRKEGLSRKRLLYKGEWVDLVLYAATAEDFGIRWKFEGR